MGIVGGIMHKVVHFEFPTDNPERAIQFFGDLFGWKFKNWEGQPYWVIEGPEGDGINGGMMPRNGPDHPITNVIQVEDVDAHVPKIESAGGTIVVPKMAITGVGYCAYFKDPDGHIWGIYHDDPNAA